ncbi:ATPase, AAA family, partial [mine drainage metagenome]
FGTISAERPPVVIITSNRTREVHDAVKRRCIYHWVDYPDAERELEILRRHVPQARAALSRQVVAFVQQLRTLDLYKLPGLSETIEWGRALIALDAQALDPQTLDDTLGLLLKYQDDIARVRGTQARRLLETVYATGEAPRPC